MSFDFLQWTCVHFFFRQLNYMSWSGDQDIEEYFLKRRFLSVILYWLIAESVGKKSFDLTAFGR